MEHLHPPYQNGREHLEDELKRLDLLLQLRLGQAPYRRPDRIPGLVIPSEEISGCFTDSQSGESGSEELGGLRAKLATLDHRIRMRRAAALEEGVYLPLDYLTRVFGLTQFEERCLIVCLAPELDRKYEKIYAYLQDDLTQKKPAISLALQLLPSDVEVGIAAREAFDPRAPLARYLLKIIDNAGDEATPLIARALKLEERIVNVLLEIDGMDPRLEEVACLMDGEPMEDPGRFLDDPSRVAAFIKANAGDLTPGSPGEARCFFYFYGPEGAGKGTYARRICSELGLKTLFLDISAILAHPYPLTEIWRIAGREAILQNAALCVTNFDQLLENDDQHQTNPRILLESGGSGLPLVFLMGRRAWKPEYMPPELVFIAQNFTVPADHQRHKLWEELSRGYQLDPMIDLGALASKFRFTPGQIQSTLAMASYLSEWLSPATEWIATDTLYQACRAQANHKLDTLARKINPQQTWEMLVLPGEVMELLRAISDQVKYRGVVYGQWGFGRKLSYGKGLNALFSGPPGSGKTMAAEVIARELGLELFQIDLARVVSKYIGETEKNLARIFEEAQTANAILFFDEADALFGKRSEVKDAHDRYANIETGFLLKQMEEYEGIVILATNLSKNMDEAFLRRLHFSVEFPFPEQDEREQIWRKIFPGDTPLFGGIDYRFLAERLKLAGGNIKNIALSAAFLAAREDKAIGMRELLLAARQEYRKLGKPFLEMDFEPYYRLIKE